MAEVTGKMKRGAAGKSNAEASPYRLNGGGLYPLYMRRIMATLGQAIVNGMGRPPPPKGSGGVNTGAKAKKTE